MTVRVVCAACVAAIAAAAQGQVARFLEPEAASVELGSAIELTVREAGGTRPWPVDRIGHFFARTAWTQDNLDTIAAAAAGVSVLWDTERPGVTLLGFDLRRRVETVDAAGFGAFLDRSVPESRRALLGEVPAAGEVRVERVESAKALVRVTADGPGPVSIATSKTGQAVEIRPLFDPTAVTPGSDLPVKIYASIPGPAEGLVLGTNTTTGETISAPTSENATANLTIPSAGRWRLEFHAVTPIDGAHDGVEAEWLVHTATLSFEVTESEPEDGEVTR